MIRQHLCINCGVGFGGAVVSLKASRELPFENGYEQASEGADVMGETEDRNCSVSVQ